LHGTILALAGPAPDLSDLFGLIDEGASAQGSSYLAAAAATNGGPGGAASQQQGSREGVFGRAEDVERLPFEDKVARLLGAFEVSVCACACVCVMSVNTCVRERGCM